VLCETVPIYNGSTDVERWYGNCFEYIDIDSDSVIDDIRNILESDKTYDFYKAKDYYLNINNPFKILLDYIETK
jgi:hypothetical protein